MWLEQQAQAKLRRERHREHRALVQVWALLAILGLLTWFEHPLSAWARSMMG